MSINILLQTSELVPDVATCCSGSNPRPWEIVVIGTAGSKEIQFESVHSFPVSIT